LSFDAAASNCPAAISPTKPGMSMLTGQPITHSGFLHCRQRLASTSATSGEYPLGTS